MEGWKERLQLEYNDLGVKIEKLDEAIKQEKIPIMEVPILSTQLDIMKAYKGILKIRLYRS